MLAERIDEVRLLFTHEMQVKLVPPLLDVLVQPFGVATEVAGDSHRCF